LASILSSSLFTTEISHQSSVLSSSPINEQPIETVREWFNEQHTDEEEKIQNYDREMIEAADELALR
jgi:hypothetical protein